MRQGPACAAITLLVLLSVRASADAAHPVLAGLSGLTAALTIGVMAVAIRRLQLYGAVSGLTMLRLACLVAAAQPVPGKASRVPGHCVILGSLAGTSHWGGPCG